MRARSRGNLWLAAAAAIIIGTLALYVSLIRSWLSDEHAAPASSHPLAPAHDPQKLADARRALRDGFLEARSWLRLAETLRQAARPVDAFYVMQGASEFFGKDEFARAHAQVVRRAEQEYLDADALAPDEAALKKRLEADPNDPPALIALARVYARTGRANEAIPFYARLAHSSPQTLNGTLALGELEKLASSKEEGPRGETSRQAREAFEELQKAHPDDPRMLVHLAMAMWARGDLATVRALALEADRMKKASAGVAMIEGALALSDRDPDRAVKRFTAAWESDPDDDFSARQLAEIYARQRGDPEAALPFYLALYRRDPAAQSNNEPIEQIIRRTLDVRRQQMLKNASVETLARFLTSDDASLRAEACVRAAEFKDPRWIETLAELLDDDTEIVRHNADYALYQIAKAYPDAVQVRRDEWLASRRPLLQARALNLFADLWPEDTFPLVRSALRDQNPALRYLAKTMVLDRYYKSNLAAASAKAEFLAREKDPLVLARLDYDRRRDQALP